MKEEIMINKEYGSKNIRTNLSYKVDLQLIKSSEGGDIGLFITLVPKV